MKTQPDSKEVNSLDTANALVKKSYDNGKFNVEYDPQKVMQAIESAGVVPGLIALALSTAVHRRGEESRPENGSGTEAVAKWLVAQATGGSNAGRYRANKADKERAAKAVALRALKPDEVKAQWLALRGTEMPEQESDIADVYAKERGAAANEFVL